MSSLSAIVKVEKATSDLLLGPDWTMNIEICDTINLDRGLAKEVVKAVKKRLQQKSPRVQFLTLTLLETMFKNCGDSVHSLVERDILSEMIKIVRKKADMEVRDKILMLLDSWQEAFGGPGGKYPQYFWAYTDLKRSGVEFPLRTGDASLIFTPSIHRSATPKLPQRGYGMPISLPMRLDQAMASETTNLSLSDLDRIRSVVELLNDMVKDVNSRDHKAVVDEVIADLVDQCHSNQMKIWQLIDSTRDEELLAQGLALNDNLQILLAKYDAIISGYPPPCETAAPVQGPITLSSATAVYVRFEDDDEEEDEFSKLARRNSKIKPSSESRFTETNDINVVESFKRSNVLALPDPPRPIKTSSKEKHMVDLVSIISPPHAPTSPTGLRQNEPPETIRTNGQGYPHNLDGQIPYGNYAAPWAQMLSPSSSSHLQPHPFHFRPQQQSRTAVQYLPHLLLRTEPAVPHQQLESQAAVSLQYASYPPPPWEDSLSPNPIPFGINSASNLAVTVADTEASPKPFLPSYGLFEDPKNTEGVLRTMGTSDPGMANGRK